MLGLIDIEFIPDGLDIMWKVSIHSGSSSSGTIRSGLEFSGLILQ